jgi:hypothetical protein
MKDLNSILIEGHAAIASVGRTGSAVNDATLRLYSDRVSILIETKGKLSKLVVDLIGDGERRAVRVVGAIEGNERGEVRIKADHIEFRPNR